MLIRLIMFGIILQLAACFVEKTDRKSRSTDNAGNLVDESKDESEDANGSKKKKKEYRAVAGDFYLLESGSKSWNSDAVEPKDWAGGDDVRGRVLQVYDKKLSCRYYLKESIAGNNSYRDIGCKLPTFSCGISEEKCETDALESKDYGDLFNNAYGTKYTCLQVVYDDPNNLETSSRTLIETIRYVWRHRAALREDFIVEQTTKTCSLALETGEAEGGMSACKPPESRTSTMALAHELLVDQKRGPGLDSLKVQPASQVNWSGEVDLSMLKKASLPSCTISGDRLNVSFAYQYCKDNKPYTSSFSLGGLPKTETNDTGVGANAAVLTHADGTLSNENQGGCNVTVHRDSESRFLTGEGRCSNSLTGSIGGATKTEAAETFSFACHAPEGFDGIDANEEAEIEAAAAAAAGGSTGGGDTTGGGTTGGGTTGGGTTGGGTTGGGTTGGGTTAELLSGTITCEKSLKRKDCNTGKTIVSAEIIDEHSIWSGNCYKTGHWGFEGTRIWVDGCRADFKYYYNP